MKGLDKFQPYEARFMELQEDLLDLVTDLPVEAFHPLLMHRAMSFLYSS